MLREWILIIWPRLAVLQVDAVVPCKASRVSFDMPVITRTTKTTFEFRIECGDDVGRCSLRKVLRDELVSFVSFPVAQFTIECLCPTLRSVASHARNVKAGKGLTQASDLVGFYGTANVGHDKSRVDGERLEALRA